MEDEKPSLCNVLFSMVYDSTLLPYAVGAAVVSFLFLVVDYLYFKSQVNNESIMGITYKGNNFFLILLSWVGGAAVVSYFGALAKVLTPSPTSMLSIGLLWPATFNKFMSGPKEQGADVEESVVEEEE
ncbi:MAG: hypothetical protein KAU27_01935 [Desulfuromonadales bacterium]|nr:hypothetical protein [Desulfuromonadales bacterium]